jgi:hypothetical protein
MREHIMSITQNTPELYPSVKRAAKVGDVVQSLASGHLFNVEEVSRTIVAVRSIENGKPQSFPRIEVNVLSAAAVKSLDETGGPTGTTVEPEQTLPKGRMTGDGKITFDDVVPLAKSKRGTNGTTKRGKTVEKKTGDPKADAAAKKTAAKKTAEPAPEKTKRAPGPLSTKGQHVLRSRRSRVTKTLVELLNVEGEGSTMEPGKKGEKYAARCVDHNTVVYAATRSLARVDASDPSGWCKKCQKALASA